MCRFAAHRAGMLKRVGYTEVREVPLKADEGTLATVACTLRRCLGGSVGCTFFAGAGYLELKAGLVVRLLTACTIAEVVQGYNPL